MQSRRRGVVVGGFALCALVAAGGVAAAGVPGHGTTTTQPGADKVGEYIAAHRADLESSLGSLPVVEPLVLLRSMGSSFPAVVHNAAAAIYGRVVSVRVETTGALISTVEILDVGKRGRTNLTTGDTVDLTQTAHVDLDGNERPVLAEPPEAPALLAGETGIYFLSRSGSTGGFAVVGLGSTLPVVNGAIASADATVQAWVAGRSPASLMSAIRKAAQE